MSYGFEDWLAGFIDGEGCFTTLTTEGQGGRGFVCRFVLKLRLDDKPILDEIVERTGLGYVDVSRRKDPIRPGGKPTARWLIVSREDCVGLVRLLDEHPLRSKKRRDYEVWRQIVTYWASYERRYEKGRMGPVPHDWTPVLSLVEQLRGTREFAWPT